MDAKFDLLQRGQYTFVQGTPSWQLWTHVRFRTSWEARNAVQIARRRGRAIRLDSSVRLSNFFSRQRVPGTQGKQKANRNEAREAVQTRGRARHTVKRREENDSPQERAAAAEREAKAKAQAAAAERAHSKRNRLPTAPLVKGGGGNGSRSSSSAATKQPRPP